MPLFGGYGQGNPTGLGMFAQQPQQESFLDGFERRMQNPYINAALGFGGAVLGANEQGASVAQALQQGLLGGAGSAFGALRLQRQKEQEEERNRLMRNLLQRYAGVANGPAVQVQTSPVFGGGGFNAYSAPGGLF